jgi:DNA-damage-inducible protein J
MAINSSTIQLRIDKKTKEQAQRIFEKLGMDMSSGMKLFLSQVIRTRSIPFVARTENGFTPEYEQFILDEIKDAKKNGMRFKTAAEAIKYLES